MTSKRDGPLPAVAEIAAWLADQDGVPRTTEATKAFGIKGMENRRAFKALYKDARRLGREGERTVGGLPPVTMLIVERISNDGDLIAIPEKWDDPPAPSIIVNPGKQGGAIAVGTRILARIEDEGGEAVAHPIKIFTGPPPRPDGVLAFVEEGPRGSLELREAQPGRPRRWRLDGKRPPGLEVGQLVLAKPEPRRPGRASREFRASIISIHGDAEDPAVFGLAMMEQLGAPVGFPDNVTAEAEAAKPPALDGREDLRKVPLLTIDGADARDFDDAVFAEPSGGKGWRVIVAIADVSSYVEPGSALDVSARARGNSTYLPDRAIPMLPEALSNGLCSLKPNEERACLFVEMKFSAEGKRTSHRVGRGLMQSHWRLTYEDAQGIADGGLADHPAKSAVENLYAAFDCLLKGRAKRAPLELHLSERVVEFDDKGIAVNITKRPALASHQLIEEMMVQANASAAESVQEARSEALYRTHDKPDAERIGLLGEQASRMGLMHPGARLDHPRLINDVLAKADDPAVRTVLSELILRAQAQARYSPDCTPHFGLSLDAYLHFTSPIRRYADLVAHRSLIDALDLGAGGKAPDRAELEVVAGEINKTERRSISVERAVVDRYVALLGKAYEGKSLEGRIVGANRAGLFVRFEDPYLDGFAPAALLPDDYWHLSRDGMSMDGRSSGMSFRLGDSVTARVRDVEVATGSVTLELSPPEKAGKKALRRKRDGKRLPKRRRR